MRTTPASGPLHRPGRPPDPAGSPAAPTVVPDLTGADAAAAFGRLFDDHYGPLHRYLARRVGEHAATDRRSRRPIRRAAAAPWA